MPNYHQSTLQEFWESLSDALSGGKKPVSTEIRRNSTTLSLRVYLEAKEGKREAIQIYVEQMLTSGVHHWDFSELPPETVGEDIRELTLRWCADIYEKVSIALARAHMETMIVGSLTASLMPDFDGMVTSFPEQVGNSIPPEWQMS